MLDRFGMRSAYVMLMLAARSGTDFERLHGLVPNNCQVPLQTLIGLKKERERLLRENGRVGSKKSSPNRTSPSDTVVLREFDLARGRRESKPATLTPYYNELLARHAKRTPVEAISPDEHFDRGVYFPKERILPWEKDLLRCVLKGLPARLSLIFRRDCNLVCLCPEHQSETDERYLPICIHSLMQVEICFPEEVLDCDHTLKLLGLSMADHTRSGGFGYRTLCYQFDISDPRQTIAFPEPSETFLGRQIVCIDEAKLQELLAFLAKQGIELTLNPIA